MSSTQESLSTSGRMERCRILGFALPGYPILDCGITSETVGVRNDFYIQPERICDVKKGRAMLS